MHCAGTPELYTPNLDRIAEQGMRFDSFFCASPVCSPARASILTGKMPSAHGVQDWLRSGNLDGEKFAAQGKENPYFEGYKQERKPISYLEGQPTYTDILAAERLSLRTLRKMAPGQQHRTAAGLSGVVHHRHGRLLLLPPGTWWTMEKSPCIMGNM